MSHCTRIAQRLTDGEEAVERGAGVESVIHQRRLAVVEGPGVEIVGDGHDLAVNRDALHQIRADMRPIDLVAVVDVCDVRDNVGSVHSSQDVACIRTCRVHILPLIERERYVLLELVVGRRHVAENAVVGKEASIVGVNGVNVIVGARPDNGSALASECGRCAPGWTSRACVVRPTDGGLVRVVKTG